MSAVLDDTRRLLRDSAQAFLLDQAPVAHLRTLRDRNDPLAYSPRLWRAFGEQGYSATLVPEAHGGMGLGVADAALIAEQIGHTLAPTPFLSTAVLAARLLTRGGSADQQAAWLPRIAAADTVVALAVDERSRHDPTSLAMRAERSGDGWWVSGAKLLVVDGHGAEAFIVAATAEEGTLLLLLPAGTPGLTVERTVMVDAHNAARLHLDGVALDAQARIGSVGQGRSLLDDVLDAGRLIVGAELLGIADEVFDRTLQYLKDRRQFDRAIGEFQALQHRAAEWWCELELTRALLGEAAAELDSAAATAPLRVAQAKARACLAGNRAVQEAVQMHGGIGMTDELDIGLFMKRAQVLQTLFGDASFHLDRAAQLSGY